jgi:hypothetical protein
MVKGRDAEPVHPLDAFTLQTISIQFIKTCKNVIYCRRTMQSAWAHGQVTAANPLSVVDHLLPKHNAGKNADRRCLGAKYPRS